MSFLINSYRFGAGAAFDADYQAVLDYATTQGFTLPSAGQQTLQNQLVLDLKSAGVWTKFDAFYVFATDGNADFACVDWISQTYNATRVNGPTFIADVGFTGVSAQNAYLNTNYKPSSNGVNLNTNSAHIAAFSIENAYTVSSSLAGSFLSSSARMSINRRGVAGDVVFDTSGGNIRPTSNDLKIVDRQDANTVQVYDNGATAYTNTTATVSSVPNVDTHILSLNESTQNVGTEQTVCTFSIGASVWSERANYRTAITSYMTAI